MAVQLSSLWKQWGGAEMLREKGNANPPPICIALLLFGVFVVISGLLPTV